MASPAKLAHVVLYSPQVPVMRDWYLNVLDAHVVYESATMVFLTYDGEHHRIAIAAPTAAEEMGNGAEGLGGGSHDAVNSRQEAASPSHLAHIAFAYSTLKELLENWERLKRESILPVLAVNHGPTTSMYYADPDGNQIELQIDNFETVKEGTTFMESDSFTRNPFGEMIFPEVMLRRLRAGESANELVMPTW